MQDYFEPIEEKDQICTRKTWNTAQQCYIIQKASSDIEAY